MVTQSEGRADAGCRRRDCLDLVVALGRTGIVGYGGGPSILPLIRHEAVNRYGWIDDGEFAEIVAIANTLPGPIATKMAAYLGYRRQKSIGAAIAVLAHILPTTLGMVLLLGVLAAFSESPVVRGMIAVVNPVIAVLLGGMAYQFAAKAYQGLGLAISIVTMAIAALFLVVLHAPDAIVVLCFLAYGAVHLRVAQQSVQLWRRYVASAGGGEHRDRPELSNNAGEQGSECEEDTR